MGIVLAPADIHEVESLQHVQLQGTMSDALQSYLSTQVLASYGSSLPSFILPKDSYILFMIVPSVAKKLEHRS